MFPSDVVKLPVFFSGQQSETQKRKRKRKAANKEARARKRSTNHVIDTLISL